MSNFILFVPCIFSIEAVLVVMCSYLDGATVLVMGTKDGDFVTFDFSKSSNPTFMLKELEKFQLPSQG